MSTYEFMRKINDNTTMIDIAMFDVNEVGAVFLLKSGKTCLIDSGSKKDTSNIIKALNSLDAFPPDIIILTHSHWDHSQGVPKLREEALKLGKDIKVYAGEKAISLLEDQSFNKVFHDEHYENITDVLPLKEGDIVDLDGLTLKIYEVPGHTPCSIAIYDETNKDVFLGDAIGDYVQGDAIPPSMPPFWKEDEFLSSVDKLKELDYNGIGLAHFGYYQRSEAEKIIEASVEATEKWAKVFDEIYKEGKLDDIKYIVERIKSEVGVIPPALILRKALHRIIFSTINFGRKVIRKDPQVIGDILLPQITEWLVKGYKISNSIEL